MVAIQHLLYTHITGKALPRIPCRDPWLVHDEAIETERVVADLISDDDREGEERASQNDAESCSSEGSS